MFSVYGQEREATIIFNDSSSIKGFGEIKKEKIYFRVNLTSEKSEWSYDFAKGLIFSGHGFSEKYEYVKPDKYSKPRILEVVEEGNITLYKDSKMFYTSNASSIGGQLPTNVFTFENISETFYVKRKNEEFATDLTFSFKSISLRYFSDCQIIIEKIKSREFKANTIPKMVFYYNDYCGKENED